MSLMKSYSTLPNARFKGFTISELLMENEKGRKGGSRGLGLVKILLTQIKQDKTIPQSNYSR